MWLCRQPDPWAHRWHFSPHSSSTLSSNSNSNSRDISYKLHSRNGFPFKPPPSTQRRSQCRHRSPSSALYTPRPPATVRSRISLPSTAPRTNSRSSNCRRQPEAGHCNPCLISRRSNLHRSIKLKPVLNMCSCTHTTLRRQWPFQPRMQATTPTTCSRRKTSSFELYDPFPSTGVMLPAATSSEETDKEMRTIWLPSSVLATKAVFTTRNWTIRDCSPPLCAPSSYPFPRPTSAPRFSPPPSR